MKTATRPSPAALRTTMHLQLDRYEQHMARHPNVPTSECDVCTDLLLAALAAKQEAER